MTEVEVRYCGVVHNQEGKYIMAFQEKHGSRGFLIEVHPIVARAVEYEEKGVKPVLPSTHQLLCNFIDLTELNIERVILVGLINRITRFNIVVKSKGNKVSNIEAGLADSMMISIIKNCPIFANEELLFDTEYVKNIVAHLDQIRHTKVSNVDPTKSMSDEELIHYFSNINNLPEA